MGNYSVQLINNTNAAFADIVLNITFPAEMNYVGGAEPNGIVSSGVEEGNSLITWKFSEIPPKSCTNINLNFLAKKQGNSCISAELSSSVPDFTPVVSTINTKILSIGSKCNNIYDTEDPVEVGHKTTYIAEFANMGMIPATNVIVKFYIGDEFEFINAEGPSSYLLESKNIVVFEPLSILEPGEKAVYRIHCLAVQSGSSKTRCIMKYNEWEREIIDEENTIVY